MRKLSGFVLLGLLPTLFGLQTVFAQQAVHQPAKHWIFLKDKRDASGKNTVSEAAHLTDRARQRRVRRGTVAPSSLDAPLSPTYLKALHREGVRPLVRSRWLNAVSARLDDRQVAAVQALPFVRDVRPVATLMAPPEPAPALPSPPRSSAAHKNLRIDYGSSQTQLELINAIPALERGINGTGVRIGFLDTEYGEFQHRAFAHLINEGRLIDTRNFTGQSQNSRHGRAVTSVAVGFEEGQLVGPAYGAEVLAATTEYAPSETNQEEDNFVAGLEWLEAQGVDVVNTSLGYTTFDAGQQSYTPDDLNGDTAVTTKAADLAASLGVVVVTSAGNEASFGGATCTGHNQPSGCWYFISTPADGDSVIAVGGVTRSGTKYSASGFGPTADGRIKPDVAALGTSVLIAGSASGYTNGNGTSYASPIVAGVVAQILQVNPDLDPIEVRDLLRETASQANNPDHALGWGLIDADAAIQRAEQLATATETDALIPDAFIIPTPYPNPFDRETTFEIHAPAHAGFARLAIYNLLGQRVDVPFAGTLHPGVNRIVFRASSLPAGLYVYTLEGEGLSRSGKVVILR